MQFLQHVVGDVARGAGFAVQKNRDFGVAETDLLDKGAQLGDRMLGRSGVENSSSSIDRMKARGAALLLGERGQVAVSW